MSAGITAMTAADIERCVALEHILFAGDDPWRASSFAAELSAPQTRYFAARDDGGMLIGYAGIALLGRPDAPECEIHTIAVDPHFHRAGVGTMLLGAMLGEAERHGGPVYLEVRTDNIAALELYARHGFETVGVRRRYYQPSGADAFTMRRPAVDGIGSAS